MSRCTECMEGQGSACKCRQPISTAAAVQLILLGLLAFWAAVLWMVL